jgi:SAM-dependent methyltransferase
MAAAAKTSQRRHRLRIVLVLLGILLFFIALNVSSQAVGTLHELIRVEAERDQWQRPDEVLRALDLKPGNVVVDLGSGAGYFALKISKSVGGQGKVMAVDLRRLSLTFLWIRSRLQHLDNVSTIVGVSNDPRLGGTKVDAVLIANTYHELDEPNSILRQICRSLRPDGRLVVVDRGPGFTPVKEGSGSRDPHEIALSRVEGELTAGGFSVMNIEQDFIDRPGDHWWLIIVQKSHCLSMDEAL